MIARTEDMLALWSLPEDPRPADWAADELSDRLELSPERHYQELSQYTFESALWRDYARRLGFPVESWPTLTVLHRRASWPLSRI